MSEWTACSEDASQAIDYDMTSDWAIFLDMAQLDLNLDETPEVNVLTHVRT